jgi:chaperonin GroEL
MSQIKEEIDMSTSEYEKEKYGERLAKMSNGIAVLKVQNTVKLHVQNVKKNIVIVRCIYGKNS